MAHDIVIRGGTVVDGTGATAFTGDVAIDGGRIVSVGGKAGPGRQEIDADGLVDQDIPTAPRRIARDGADEIARHLPRITVAVLPHAATVTDPPLDWLRLARG